MSDQNGQQEKPKEKCDRFEPLQQVMEKGSRYVSPSILATGLPPSPPTQSPEERNRVNEQQDQQSLGRPMSTIGICNFSHESRYQGQSVMNNALSPDETGGYFKIHKNDFAIPRTKNNFMSIRNDIIRQTKMSSKAEAAANWLSEQMLIASPEEKTIV
jgi:hypothetical protein